MADRKLVLKDLSLFTEDAASNEIADHRSSQCDSKHEHLTLMETKEFVPHVLVLVNMSMPKYCSWK